MDQYLFKQIFSIAVAVILLVTFYIVLALNTFYPSVANIQTLVLIIMSVVALAIYGELVTITRGKPIKRGGKRK